MAGLPLACCPDPLQEIKSSSPARSSAIDGRSLVDMKALLELLAKVCPELLFKYSSLKRAFMDVLQDASLRSRWPGKETAVIAGDLADQLMTVCCHTRRLRDQTRFREASSKLSSSQASELQELRSMLDQQPEEQPEEQQPAAAGSSTAPALPEAASPVRLKALLDEDVPKTPGDVQTPESCAEWPGRPTKDSHEEMLKLCVPSLSVPFELNEQISKLEAEAEAALPAPSRKQRIRDQWEQLKRPAAAEQVPEGKAKQQKTAPEAKAMVKRPAAAEQVPEAKAKQQKTVPDAKAKQLPNNLDFDKDNLCLMRYHNTGAVAIRVKGGRQLLQVNGKGFDPQHNENIATVLLKELEKGAELQQVLALKASLMAKQAKRV